MVLLTLVSWEGALLDHAKQLNGDGKLEGKTVNTYQLAVALRIEYNLKYLKL